MNTQQPSDFYQTTIDYYNQHAQEFYDQTVNMDMSVQYQWFLKELPQGAHILDAGCGSGRDSLFFKTQGYRVTSIDPSEEMVQLASTFLGQEVLKFSFQDLEFEEEFDGIWACASLLHVPRTEMHEVLRRLSRALKLGGVLYASFKYGDEELTRGGRFFNSYTEDSIATLLKAYHELKLVSISMSEDARIDRQGEHWLNALAKRWA